MAGYLLKNIVTLLRYEILVQSIPIYVRLFNDLAVLSDSILSMLIGPNGVFQGHLSALKLIFLVYQWNGEEYY